MSEDDGDSDADGDEVDDLASVGSDGDDALDPNYVIRFKLRTRHWQIGPLVRRV